MPTTAAVARELTPEQYMVLGDYHRVRLAFESDAAVARAVGVHRSQVGNWRRGGVPRPETARLLSALATAVEALSRAYHPAVIEDWLRTETPETGGRTPLEMLREGRLPEVLELANAAEHGAFS